VYTRKTLLKKERGKTSREKLKFAKCWKAQLTGMRKRAGRKGYKEKDREDGGRMVKRRWRGRRDRGMQLGG
jgi:hypothetical protein